MLGAGDAVQITGSSVSAGTFRMLGVSPSLGRWFAPDEEAAGGEHVVILSDNAWRRYLAADPNVLGTRLTFTGNTTFTGGLAFGASYTVVGVMPREFYFPDQAAEFWTPNIVMPPADNRPRRISLLAQLADGVSIEAAREEVSGIVRRSAASRSATHSAGRRAAVRARTRCGRDNRRHPARAARR